MGRDAKAIIDDGTMHAAQWAAILVTVGLNALDGFDVLSISFASPGIAKDWGVAKDTLGWLLSMELLGMAVGSVLLGGLSDKLGRRPTILGCLVAMSVGMFGASQATHIPALLGWRLLTGLGIGGTLASINAAAAELSNRKWRNFAMSLMVIGYPLGGIVGGLVVQRILSVGAWPGIFRAGAWATAACIPLVWALVPEPVAFLDRRRPNRALERINATLRRLGHESVESLTAPWSGIEKHSVLDILKPGLLAVSLLVTFAYFAHIMSFYFILKWVPKIIVDLGYDPKAAAGVLTWANVGGATGGALFGLIATRVPLRKLTAFTLLGAFVLVAWFGQGAADLGGLTAKVAVAGFFTNAAIVGLYLLLARLYPAELRATGTGFAIGVGRGGAAIGPIVAGYLFQFGLGLAIVAPMMALGSLASALALFVLKAREVD